MPETDSRSGTHDALGVANPPSGPSADFGHEEGLATALSAFLAQLHDFEDQPEPAAAPAPVATPEVAVVANEQPASPAGPRTLARRPTIAGMGMNPGLGRVVPPSDESTKAVVANHRPPPMKVLPPVHRPARAATTPGTPPAAATGAPQTDQPGLSKVPQVDVWGPSQEPKQSHKRGPAAVTVAPTPPPAAPAAAPAPPAVAPLAPTASAPTSATAAPVAVPSSPASASNPAPSSTPPGANPHSQRNRRLGYAISGGLALTAVAASLAWGISQHSQLAQANQQLQTNTASLSALNSALSAQSQRYQKLHKAMAAFMGQFENNKSALTSADKQLEAAQSQLTSAQNQVNQAQSQLDNTQQNLTVTQSHATQCQVSSTLGQQTVQLMASVNLSEINYLNAAQSKNVHLMQSDISQMRQLLYQEQALAPRFTAALGHCTHS